MKVEKKAKSSGKMYSLCIHLKYGDILHVEDLNSAEKDVYFDLSRKSGGTLLLETKSEIRNLCSEDISRITSVAYDKQYKDGMHRVKSMLFSESSIGNVLFSLIPKLFYVIAVILGIASIAATVIDGSIFDMLTESSLILDLMNSTLASIAILFKVVFVTMLVLNIVDFVLPLDEEYFVNRDGMEEVDCSRISNLLMTGKFLFVILILNAVIGFALNTIF